MKLKNPEKTVREIVNFIREETRKRSGKILVPLSGGVDSAVSAALSQKTDLDTKLLTVNDMIYYRQEDLMDAQRVARNLGLEHEVIDATDSFRTIREKDPLVRKHTMMGFRSALIKAAGEREERTVISTGNASEFYAGIYCFNTLIGEICPLADLYKTQVYTLASILNLPSDVRTKPSHDGIEGDPTDEEMLGLPFYQFDTLAYLLKERKRSSKEIAKKLMLSERDLIKLKEDIDKNEVALKFPMLNLPKRFWFR